MSSSDYAADAQVVTKFDVIMEGAREVRGIIADYGDLKKSFYATRMAATGLINRIRTFNGVSAQAGQRAKMAGQQARKWGIGMNSMPPALAKTSRMANMLNRRLHMLGGGGRAATRGLRGAGAAATGASGGFANLSSILGVVAGAAATFGLGAAIRTVNELNSTAEEARNTVAGYFQTFEIAGSFTDGLKLADQTMRSIKQAAAALPGEASDYITVFRGALPEVQNAVKGGLDEMTKFTNRYTAIAATIGVDSQQAARDLRLMLRAGKGGAGADVRTYVSLAPFLKKVEGQQDLTREKFNKMDAAARASLLAQAMQGEGLSNMLKNASSSYDAVKGAAKSALEETARLATTPLFEASKKALDSFASSLLDSKGELTALGESIQNVGHIISNALVGGISAAFGWAAKLGKMLHSMWTSPAAQAFMDKLSGLKETAGAMVAGIAGATPASLSTKGSSGAIGAAVGGASMMLGPVQAFASLLGVGVLPLGLLIGGFVEFAQRGEVVSTVLANLTSAVSLLAEPLMMAGALFTLVTAVVGDMLSGVLPGLSSGLFILVDAITGVATTFLKITFAFVQKLRPIVAPLFKAIGQLAKAIGEVLGPVIRLLGAAFNWLWDKVTIYALPVIDKLVQAFSWLITGLSGFLSWLGKKIGEYADKLDPEKPKPKVKAVPTMKLSEMLGAGTGTRVLETMAPGGPAVGAGGGKGGKGVTMNFPYARFQIQQKFAEGYDPGRVAVAFARDIGKIGEHSLQSGFEPLFAVG